MKARLWMGISAMAAMLPVGAIGAQTAVSPVRLGGLVMGSPFNFAAVTNQPYSLVETTTTVRTLADGTTLTHVIEEHRMRDAEGRTRSENYMKRDGKSQLEFVNITDPVARTSTMLFLRNKTANVRHFEAPKPPTAEQQQQRADRLAKFRAEHAASPAKGVAAGTADERPVSHDSVETLTPQTVAGVYAKGMRFTHIIPPGREGNDREIRVVSEIWTSPDLQIMVRRTMDDPQTGKTTMVVTDLERSDPAPSLFQVPADYKVVDLTKPSLASAP